MVLDIESQSLGIVHSSAGIALRPSAVFDDIVKPQIVVVPAGPGTISESQDSDILSWLKLITSGAELILSMCTGARLLDTIGLLDGLEVTTHPDAAKIVQEAAPNAKVISNIIYRENGRILCGLGLIGGVEISLHAISRLLGVEAAIATARALEYDWSGSDVNKKLVSALS